MDNTIMVHVEVRTRRAQVRLALARKVAPISERLAIWIANHAVVWVRVGGETHWTRVQPMFPTAKKG